MYVLIIKNEGESAYVDQLQRQLNSIKWQACVIDNEDDAFFYLKTGGFDAAFVYGLPSDFISKIKKMLPDLPVIGVGNNKKCQAMLDVGATLCFELPIPSQDIMHERCNDIVRTVFNLKGHFDFPIQLGGVEVDVFEKEIRDIRRDKKFQIPKSRCRFFEKLILEMHTSKIVTEDQLFKYISGSDSESCDPQFVRKNVLALNKMFLTYSVPLRIEKVEERLSSSLNFYVQVLPQPKTRKKRNSKPKCDVK